MRERKKEQNYDIKLLIVTIILWLIVLFMVFKLGSYVIEMVRNEKYADDLQESVLIMDTEEIGSDAAEGGNQEDTKEIIIPESIDFEKLHEISDDAVAWIYDPGMTINYVIAQAADNDYYLYRQLNGIDNKNGTLFMDYRNHSDFSDWNTFVYGHNMKNGSMFASLMDYRNPGYYEKHPVMYIYVPGQRYKLELLVGYTTTEADTIFQLPDSKEEREEILDRAYRLSTFESNIRPEETDHLVTLSTCSYVSDDARYLVIGRLVAE